MNTGIPLRFWLSYALTLLDRAKSRFVDFILDNERNFFFHMRPGQNVIDIGEKLAHDAGVTAFRHVDARRGSPANDNESGIRTGFNRRPKP